MEPLKGLRVLDFSRLVAGSGATRVLAGFGAEVIRVEWPDPPALDSARQGHWNVDKRSLALDMKSAKGLAIAKRLLAISDIVMENMRPRVMRGLGLDYEAARAIRPDVVYCSMSGWGQNGPKRDWGSYGASSAAHTGIAFLAGLPDYPPAGLGIAYSDENPPWLAATAILMALHYRRRTGNGTYIDMAQTQAAATYPRYFYLDRSVNGRGARRPGFPNGNGREYPPAAPHNAFRCAGGDSWSVIAVTTEDEWNGLKRAMGGPAWAADARFATTAGRYEHRQELEAHVAAWTAGYERFTLAALLQEHGVPAAAVESSVDLAEFDPQIAHRGTYQIYQHAGVAPARYNSQAPKLSKSPYTPKRAVPNIGEDTDYVLRDLLGMGGAEIEALAAEGIVRPYGRSSSTNGAR